MLSMHRLSTLLEHRRKEFETISKLWTFKHSKYIKLYHSETSTDAKTLNKAAREGQDASLEAPEEWLVSVRSNFE